MNDIASIAATALTGTPTPQAGSAAGKPKADGASFADALEQAAKSAAETIGNAESVSMKAAAGEAEILDVVTAVNDAEATLRTVVSVRDKVMQSYQEIMRMPI